MSKTGQVDHGQVGALGASWTQDHKLAGVHYGLLLAIYSVYGYQVCPFLDQLTPLELLAPVAAMLGLQWVARFGLQRLFAKRALQDRVRSLFWRDWGLFLFGGVALAFFNLFVHGFPLESGGKILMAFASIGFYISLDLALVRERRLAQELTRMGVAFPISAQFMPYQKKFALFSVLNLVILASVVLLMVYKDLHWISVQKPDLQMALLVIMAEISFVVAAVGGYTLRVIKQYSRNIDASLQAETAGLRQVEEGELSVIVPVTSNDEFGHMADLTNRMIGKLKLTNEALARTQDVTMMSLIALAAKRDNETGMHIRRTQTYVAMLAKALRDDKGGQSFISDDMIDLLYKSAPLHDIGKVGVPDEILKKPGKLTDAEFEIMKTHAQIGADALADAEKVLGTCSFLSCAREIAQTHHEKWDGSGYPHGLKGEEIPLSGRLMALADVYDALRSPRVYKPGFDHATARSIIVDGRGSHFDPDIVDAFLKIEPMVEKMAAEMSDDVISCVSEFDDKMVAIEAA